MAGLAEPSPALQEAIEAAGLTVKSEYKIREACMILGLQDVWVRRAIKTGVRQGYLKDGVWYIPLTTIQAWWDSIEERQERKLQRARNPEEFVANRRPSRMAVRMIRKRVQEDTSLTDEERELLLRKLEEYKTSFDDAHERRKNNHGD